jgi:hypothetical protein
MSKFHYDTVISAVKLFAFPQIDNLDNYKHLPYQEPPFRFIQPEQALVTKELISNDVYISKKPEGNREIFVCLYDKADSTVHMYSVDRHKNIKYIFPDTLNQVVPLILPPGLERLRKQSVAERSNNSNVPLNTLNVMFVFDVCRVYSSLTRQFINVILSDIGPIHLYNLHLSLGNSDEVTWLQKNFNLVDKRTMKYTHESQIHEIMNTNEAFPYHPENGVIFVQGDRPSPKAPCAKYTPPEHASVYLHVLPIITLKARIWKLSVYQDSELALYKTIPAPNNFYVPPTGMVVSFGIHFDERGYWKFFPKHIRQDKLTPSTIQTVQRFVARYNPNPPQRKNNKKRRQSDADSESETEEERAERQFQYDLDRLQEAHQNDSDFPPRSNVNNDNAFA